MHHYILLDENTKYVWSHLGINGSLYMMNKVVFDTSWVIVYINIDYSNADTYINPNKPEITIET